MDKRHATLMDKHTAAIGDGGDATFIMDILTRARSYVRVCVYVRREEKRAEPGSVTGRPIKSPGQPKATAKMTTSANEIGQPLLGDLVFFFFLSFAGVGGAPNLEGFRRAYL